ncbi:uncharacterized protein LOC122386317 isoform X1 [Amphibalanus amphitrite]|uniref:uncharacterized protein LOC122386317 isoform X1 n=1 Tax=Amphibalanus amphitrite TaxID=1232801 RepID=UPI001C8FBE09|nr:uncharacterized protein LOC122386317 isoform X1 [Amphibalanus amphitrite]
MIFSVLSKAGHNTGRCGGQKEAQRRLRLRPGAVRGHRANPGHCHRVQLRVVLQAPVSLLPRAGRPVSAGAGSRSPEHLRRRQRPTQLLQHVRRTELLHTGRRRQRRGRCHASLPRPGNNEKGEDGAARRQQVAATVPRQVKVAGERPKTPPRRAASRPVPHRIS